MPAPCPSGCSRRTTQKIHGVEGGCSPPAGTPRRAIQHPVRLRASRQPARLRASRGKPHRRYTNRIQKMSPGNSNKVHRVEGGYVPPAGTPERAIRYPVRLRASQRQTHKNHTQTSWTLTNRHKPHNPLATLQSTQRAEGSYVPLA